MQGKNKIAIYAGTFDPITLGHVDIIKRALKIFDRLIIAVGENPGKKPLFSVAERMQMIQQVTKGMKITVDSFHGLLVDYAKKKNSSILIRSLRAVSDFDYEFQMSILNRQLDSKIETVFLMTDKEYFFLSSGLAKDVAAKNGKLESMLPSLVAKKLRQKLGN